MLSDRIVEMLYGCVCLLSFVRSFWRAIVLRLESSCMMRVQTAQALIGVTGFVGREVGLGKERA